MSTPAIDIRPDHWQIVRHILHLHVPQYAVWAFGSRAKWTAKPHSDLDLAIITDKPLPLSVSAALTDDFSESNLPWKVDVVDWAATSEPFRNVIERDKVVVQEPQQNSGQEWRALQDVVDDILDRRGVTPLKLGGDFTSEGHRVISAKVVKGGRIDLNADEARFVSADIYKKWMKNPLRADDVVMTSEAPLGELAYLDHDVDWALGQRLFAIRPRANVLSGRFLYYALSTPEVRDSLIARSSGTTVIGIRQAELRKVEVPVPPIEEQRAIARILGALDDKIELNRRMNLTLEAMARALFKSRFVDFNGVLPEDMRESELGLTPKDFRIASLSDVLEIIGGGTPKTSVTEYWGGDIPWFSVVDTPAAGDVFVTATEKSITQAGLDGSSVRLIPKGTTIISARGTVGNLAIAGRDMTFNQSCYGLRGKNGAGDYFVFLTAQRMVDQLKSMAHGSVFSTITRQTFDAIRIAVPSEKLFQQFEQSASILFERILANVQQARTLMELRDALLPKLISGELRVKDAERFVGSTT